MNHPSVKLLGLFFAALFLAVAFEFLNPLRSHLLTFFTIPFKGYDYSHVLQRQWVFGLDKEKLELENALLKGELLKTVAEINEYRRLREVLRGKEEDAIVLGYIIARRFDAFSSVFIVDRGKLSGIREGLPVESQGALVGYTRELGENIVTVEAIWSPSFEVSGVLEKSGIPILLQGQGGGFLVGKVPREISLEKGDIVIKDMASQFVIGEIVSDATEAVSPLKEIVVRSSVQTTIIERVFIHIK